MNSKRAASVQRNQNPLKSRQTTTVNERNLQTRNEPENFRTRQLRIFRAQQNQTQAPSQQSTKNKNVASKEKPVSYTNKSQNEQPIERFNRNQPIERKRKIEISKSFSTFNNTLFVMPPKRLNLEFSNSTSIVCYFDYSQPSKVSRISFINDQPKHFFRKKKIRKRKNNDKSQTENKEEEEEDGNKTEIKEEEESSFMIDLAGHSPIPRFSKEDILKYEEEEEEEEIYNNSAYPNDIMNKYWPKRCESKRSFEAEFFDFNQSMRVKSIRNPDIIPSGSPSKEEMPPLIPEQVTEMQKKYEKNPAGFPPLPHSPFLKTNNSNPRQKKHHQRNKVNFEDHLKSPSVSDKYKTQKNVTPKRNSLNDDDDLEFDDSLENSENDDNSENSDNLIKDDNSEKDDNLINDEIGEYSNSTGFEEESEAEYNSEESNNKSKSKDETENNDDNENLFSKTNSNLEKELDNYEELISKMYEDDIYEMIFSIENELKGFNNMTGIKGPSYEDEMTVVRPKNMNCEIIDTIHPEAFEEFRFGNCVYYSDDISPDELHINAWHNLGIDPDHMTFCLDKFIQQNIHGKNDISNIYGVLRYILKWVQLYPDDFERSPECARHAGKVLNRIIEKRKDISSRPNILKALIKAISKRSKTFAVVQYPLPKVTNIYFPKGRRISIYDNIFKFEKDIDLLVQHFTYIDISLLRKVLRSEIIQLNFLKKDKNLLSPNVQEISSRFNIVARFVSYSILSVVRNHANKLEKKCKSRIEFWISVMKKAREIKNFCLLYEIDAGLSNPSITRLKNAWDSISKSQRDEFNKLHEITKPVSENINKYFKLVFKEPKKTVPFLGPFYTKIVYVCELYHDKTHTKMEIPKNKLNGGSKDGNETVEVLGYNMVYQYNLYKESSSIFLDWGADYKFQLDDIFLQTCMNIPLICDDKRLREFSVQIQPKNNS